ncbi:class II glutamine amidotransferase [Micromonospora sp. NBC_01813]|uniref:class II glutamine amidotransferase n=1 Tax=Micromonospora sp. NBC_01813 TaxID=2975988 RepID=UPI002DDA75CC|nr:class II glutamine amidotransferase [Micromonospora sp. NBC_01813]WSA11532.1 class II glutamine amidotransferase [Micromonospora sp. NBC_01813]
MCLLTFFPAGQQPNTNALYNGAMFNADGHGWAIVAGDRLIVGHSMKDEQAIEEFATARLRAPQGPAIFHSRFTTHGDTNLSNCHPFYVGRDRRTVLAHNGVLPANVQPRKGDHRSDTRIAAERFIPGVGSLHLKRTRLRVEKWMGSHNKIAILSVNPRYKESAYLLNEKAGSWDDGIWYSNDGYLPYVFTPSTGWSTYYGKTGTGWPSEKPVIEDPVQCRVCDQETERAQEICDWCNSCLDCSMGATECLCYKPMALTKEREYTKWWEEAAEAEVPTGSTVIG